MNVGEAFVTLLPDMDRFGPSFDRDVRKVTKTPVEVKTDVDTRGVGRRLAEAGRDGGKRMGAGISSALKLGLAGVGAAAGLVAGQAVVGFLRDATAEARGAQKVGAVTAQVIKATGGAARISADQVGDLAEALSVKTGTDDEAIQSGANLLLTFKNVRNEAGQGANVFDRATAAAVDLSATGFGSIEGSSKMLGKALNDPVKGISALGRAGVTFSEDQKKAIKRMVETGDVLGAQKIILQEVESQVGGVAEASATAGEKMSVAFGNFKESAGTALLPLIDAIADGVVKYAIPALEDMVGFVTTHQEGFTRFFVGGAKAAVGFGLGLSKVAVGGLRGFAALTDGIDHFIDTSIDHFGNLLSAAARSFSWIPGIGPKLQDADRSFGVFADEAKRKSGRAGDAMRGIADGIEGKVIPALDSAQGGLEKFGKTEISKAAQRDAAAKTAKAIGEIGTKADGSQVKIKRFSDITDLSTGAQRKLRGQISDARRALDDQVDAARDAGAGQKKLTATWVEGKRKLRDEFIQMGLSKKEAGRLADKYAGVKPKVKTKFETPGLGKARSDTQDFINKVKTIKGKTVTIKYATNASFKGFKVNLTAPSALGRLADGGTVTGRGGPRQDNIAGVDPHTGQQTAAVSVGEEVINERAARANRAILKAINAGRGKRFEARPVNAYANGGTITARYVGNMRALTNTAGLVEAGVNRWAEKEGRRVGKIIQEKINANSGQGDPGGPLGSGSRRTVNWKGGTFTERFRNTLIRAQRIAGVGIPVMQGGFSRRVAASGTSHYGDAIDTSSSGRILSGLRRARVAAWLRGPAQGFIPHIHGVPLPGAGFAGGSGVWQAQDYLRGGNGLRNGGTVSARLYDRGGILPAKSATLAVNNTSKGETIRTHEQERALTRPIILTLDLGEGIRQRVDIALDQHGEYTASVARMGRY